MSVSFFLYFFFESRSCYVVQAGLKFAIFLPPECWYYRCAPPHLTIKHFFKIRGREDLYHSHC
jgi:hypothetical protein